MRKLHLKVTVLLVIVLIASIASGCSKSKEKSKEIEIVTSLQTKPLTATTLTFYYPSVLGGFDIRKDANLVFKEIEKKAEDLKIELDFKAVPFTEFQQKTEAAIESGEPIDAIILLYSPYNDFTALARKGELADIEKLLPQYAPNIAQMLSEYGQRCIEVNGKAIGLPALTPMVNRCIVSAREDFLVNYKIPDIKTLDDYETYLKTVKENEGDIAPGLLDDKMIMIFAKAYGYEVLDEVQNLVYKRDDPNMRVRAWEQTPEFKEAVNLICKWHKNGYIAEGSSNDDLNNASKISSTLFHDSITGIEDTYVTPGGITMKYFLMYPDIKMTRVSLSNNNGAIAFNSHSPDIERALMFLDWVQKDQENYELFIYGIKGKHYIIKDDQIKLPEGVNYYNSRYYPWEGFETFQNVKWERRDGADNKNGAQLILKNSQYAPHEGFHPDYSKVQDEVNSRESLILSEINDPLFKGTFMNENINDVIESLRRMGTEEIVDEVQQQLDKWRASH